VASRWHQVWCKTSPEDEPARHTSLPDGPPRPANEQWITNAALVERTFAGAQWRVAGCRHLGLDFQHYPEFPGSQSRPCLANGRHPNRYTFKEPVAETVGRDQVPTPLPLLCANGNWVRVER
jgi:hypothetical protein